MGLWQRRGIDFGRRSSLLRRGEALAKVMEESIAFLRGFDGLVLDVGCGDGIPTATIARHHRVLGVDFASTMLRRAHHNLPSSDFLRASIDLLPLKGNSIPAVTCYFVLSDYDSRIRLLSELRRVLTSGGKLVVSDYSSDDDFNNLIDSLYTKVLGKERGMFRVDRDTLSREMERIGFKIRASKEICYPLVTRLETFVDQLYLSSAGSEFRQKRLGLRRWRELLSEWLKGSEIHLTRRFALVLADRIC